MKRLLLIIFISIFYVANIYGQGNETVLSLNRFISSAAENDPAFQKILIERLYLKYSKDLNLPLSDIVLSVTGQYGLFVNNENKLNKDYEGAISLSKLFPFTATEVKTAYSKTGDYGLGRGWYSSTFSVEVSQEIAKNAFGRTTRKKDSKIGIENELARHQIIEAYEDYLAALIKLYLEWYSAYEKLKASEIIYRDSVDLNNLVRRKRRYRIAFPEDVDKSYLERLDAREELITWKDQFNRLKMNILSVSGLKDKSNLKPVRPVIDKIDTTREATFHVENSRTFVMLNLLEKHGVIDEKIAKDDLLPSASLFAGYNLIGDNYRFINPGHKVYFGISGDMNFGKQREKAVRRIARINIKKNRITRISTLLTLKTNLFNLYSELRRQGKLISLAENKLKISKKVFRAVKRNYYIGKASLNDLIIAKNQADENRYKKIYHDILFQQLIVEWKRLSDVLVKRRDLLK
ncbi:TolC family protein [Spirochaetota bacterium]